MMRARSSKSFLHGIGLAVPGSTNDQEGHQPRFPISGSGSVSEFSAEAFGLGVAQQ